MTVQNIAEIIETIAPLGLQESYDNSGLQCGDPQHEVTHIMTVLDVTEDVIEEAHRLGCQMIVSHHPLLFRGTKCINPRHDYISRCLMLAIRYDIALYAAHTNLDNAFGGVNYRLGNVLGLQDVKPLIPSVQGEGHGTGLIGTLEEEMPANEFLKTVRERLNCKSIAHNGTGPDKVRSVALCGGAGSDFIKDAERAGADAYITGEARYHEYFGHPDILFVTAGHFQTEQFTVQLLKEIIENRANVEVHCNHNITKLPIIEA